MMVEPYRTLFSKLPEKSQNELYGVIKKLSFGFSGQIRLHCTNGVIAKSSFLVGPEQLEKPLMK